MKCPHCNTDLVQTKRDGLDVDFCPSCKGMLSVVELDQLEDEVFNFDDSEKGSLMLHDTAVSFKCPVCEKPMREFGYRLFDLEMDYCPDGHGYWLDADEDQRVLELMEKEEKDTGRRVLAEDRWKAHMRYLRSGSVMDKIRELVVIAMDPKPKA
jgi:Zn-finger nucleic acid-binding protein